MKRRMFVCFCYGVIISCAAIAIFQSHILTPLKFRAIENQDYALVSDETIKIQEADKLDSTCYTGSLDDRIPDYKYYNGILNYLCETYGLKHIKISVKKASAKKVEKGVIAGASGTWGMDFNYNTIQMYNPDKTEITHIVYHEYIHMLMFRKMASSYTLASKSTKLITTVAEKFNNLPSGLLYPTEYANAAPGEQIAEILSLYMTKRIIADGDYVLVSNFERELYSQFMLNAE